MNIHGSFNMDDQRVILGTHKNVQMEDFITSGINGAEVSEFLGYLWEMFLMEK